jgi:hypothetical protein
MKKVEPIAVVLALALLMAALSGCQTASYEARYELLVTEAVVEEEVPEEGPRTDKIAVSIVWKASSRGLDAHVANPADTTAAILWENATFSYESGEREPLVATAPQAGPDLPQPPTTVPGGGQMIVGMLPRSHAEWAWLPNRAMGGMWRPVSGLFGVEFEAEQTESEFRSVAETAIGRKAKITLDIRTGGRTITYIYDVRVTGAGVRAALS